MTLTKTAGDKVALVGARAYLDPKMAEVVIHGLFVLDSFEPVDRAAYVHEPGWWVTRDGDDSEVYFVPLDVLTENVDPDAHARQLVLEREMDFASEQL